MNTENDFTMINPSKTGARRENSLYHFIHHHLDLDLLRDYSVATSKSPTRHAFFISITPSVFVKSPFGEFDYHGMHLSIDKNYMNENSFNVQGHLSASHFFLLYRHQTDQKRGIRVHVRVTQNGQLTRDPFQINDCVLNDSGHVVSVGKMEPCDSKQKQLILAQMTDAKELLTRLLHEKNMHYVELEMRAAELGERLEKFHRDNVTYDNAGIIELINLTERLTLYSDVKIDGRTSYLNRLLSELQSRTTSRNIESPMAVSDVDITTESLDLPISQIIKSNEDNRLHREIEALVLRIKDIEAHQTDSIADRLIKTAPLYTEFNLCCLCLPSQHSEFIREQEKLLVLPTLKNYFHACVLSGDLLNTEKLYPSAFEQFDLRDLFIQLITTIFAEQEPNNAILKQRIAVADFFYDVSQSYRSQLALNSYGKLVMLFIQNNFFGFEMLLRQGIEADSMQFYCDDKAFNALQMIIALYSKQTDLRYIDLLLASGAEIQFTPMLVNPALRSRLKLPRLNHPPAANQDWNKLHPIRHAMEYVLTAQGYKYPEVIALVGQHSDIEHLFIPLLNMVTSEAFIKIEIHPMRSGHMSRVFSSRIDCDNYTKSLPQVRLTDNWMPCLFFYVNPNSSNTAIADAFVPVANQLMEQIIQKFSSKSLALQRQIRDHFQRDALTTPKTNKQTAYTNYLAARLAASLLDQPEFHDFEFMLQLFCLLSSFDVENKPEAAKNFIKAGHVFMSEQSEPLTKHLRATKAGKNILSKILPATASLKSNTIQMKAPPQMWKPNNLKSTGYSSKSPGQMNHQPADSNIDTHSAPALPGGFF